MFFCVLFFFFFQAEDGIRDGHVTGVQTCALPISPARPPVPAAPPAGSCRHWDLPRASRARDCPLRRSQSYSSLSLPILAAPSSVRSRDFGIVALAAPGRGLRRPEIGRASCRERVEGSAVG